MYGMDYMYEEEMLQGFFTGFTSVLQIPSTLLSIASYVLAALALYTLAQRRGLKKPWLAWIPVVNCWLVGSLSDQYQYVVKGQRKSKRKILLGLNLTSLALAISMIVLCVGMVIQAVMGAYDYASENEILSMVLGPMAGILGLCLPVIGISIAYSVIYYIALYDIYKSMDPGNCVLYLVLSIVFSVTAPFFLFFNRNKDLGMPPRRYAPPPISQPVSQSAWEPEDNDSF